MMVFGSKPNKSSSLTRVDKRMLSLLNSDFKLGVEARRLKSTSTRILWPCQLEIGDDRQIHHGINLARDAIIAAGKSPNIGCGIADTDYQADLILILIWSSLSWQRKE